MGLNYLNLDPTTRESMLAELQLDITSGKLYLSDRLNEDGIQEFPSILHDALSLHDDDWLAAQLETKGLLVASEPRRKRKGGYSYARLPANAPETLAEGEFNRFYVRGLCVRAIAEGIQELFVYRAKSVASPRYESEALIGKPVNPRSLLADLRRSQGVEPALGIPQGPNSGISVRMP